MATVNAAIDRVRGLLRDEVRPYQWSDAELIGWLNDAQVAICDARPEACTVTDVMALDGGTRQTLPDGAIRLLDVTRNMKEAT
jgi:hypothetical protein